MRSRQEAIDYCLSLDHSYEDQPFRDKNWTVVRHKDTNKVFAWIFEKEDHIWINVKCESGMMEFLRQAYTAVVPAFHLNKDHWNSIILDGTVPEEEIREMIKQSYVLTKASSRG